MIPGGEPGKAKANTASRCFVFIITFTNQVLFGHSKNKTTRRLAGDLLWLRGERGIRTPGTVTHTAV